ncbi:hypothetical protein BJ944DRAFT_290062 [Cunninghamella echinulata]|nr:hypothetical protein BJ944DRAFT_290062 [Cunninghamella echinulata]
MIEKESYILNDQVRIYIYIYVYTYVLKKKKRKIHIYLINIFQKKTHYIIKRELNLFIESIQEFKKSILQQQSPYFHQHKLILIHHADRLIDALVVYHDEQTSCQLERIERKQVSIRKIDKVCYKWIIKKFINKKKKSIEKKNTIKTSTFFQYKNSIRDLFTKKCNNENNYCQNNEKK